MNEKERKDYVLVFGGPGASGCSTIAKMFARYFDLEYVYGGELMRKKVKEMGYEDLEDFLTKEREEEIFKIDREIDTYLRKKASKGGVVIDSKIFAGLASLEGIPCTAKVWIHASLYRRAIRSVSKLPDLSIGGKVKVFLSAVIDLQKRQKTDAKRYKDLYGIEYNDPLLYNDLVIDSTNIDEKQTFDLILERLKDGGYIE